MTAPERIWLQDGGDFDAASEVTWCQHSIDDADTEYVRADLAAVQPAQVRVKPLVWEEDTDPDSDDFRAFVARSPTLHLRYIVRKVYGGFWKLTGCVPFGTPNFLTLEAAKAAAQADYEARILAALEPQPDPRDEVIARLVEALRNLLGIAEDEGIVGDKTTLELARAALAAAKAVQK